MGEVVAELRQRIAAAEARGGRAARSSSSIPGSASPRTRATASRCCAACPRWPRWTARCWSGPSRKSFIGKVLDLPVGERLMGTAAAVAACVLAGAHVVRVHDVRPMVEVARMCDAILRGMTAALRRRSGRIRADEFTWLDALDILIVAFLIYQLLQFIRGTHAVQMAVGGLHAGGRSTGARSCLHLETVNWLLRTFLPYLVFGIIVVFQAEIRKVLAHLGKAPLLGRLRLAAHRGGHRRGGARRDHAVRPAHRRHHGHRARDGAAQLHRDRHRRWTRSLTYDLLISIFNPGTPLHDGAVVIQGNRVAAAACFLPLTVNPQLSRELGSRHRAAIGVTEDTDAIAVVVSEETGTISRGVGGQHPPRPRRAPR